MFLSSISIHKQPFDLCQRCSQILANINMDLRKSLTLFQISNMTAHSGCSQRIGHRQHGHSGAWNDPWSYSPCRRSKEIERAHRCIRNLFKQQPKSAEAFYELHFCEQWTSNVIIWLERVANIKHHLVFWGVFCMGWVGCTSWIWNASPWSHWWTSAVPSPTDLSIL